MNTPTPLPSASRPLTAAEKQRSDGIKANYIKEGRTAERADWCKTLGVASMAEATEIAHLRASEKAHAIEIKVLHHRHLRADFAKFLSGVVVSMIAIAAAAWVLGYSNREAIMMGAAVGSSNPVVLHDCAPGAVRTPDGRAPCGLPQSAP